MVAQTRCRGERGKHPGPAVCYNGGSQGTGDGERRQPMVQRDYILRLIEQLGPISGALIRSAELRKGHQYREAGKSVEEALRQYFSLSVGAARERSAEELVGMVRLGWSPYAGREALGEKLTLLAALLREQADLDAAEGDEEGALDGRIKALQIFLTVLIENDATSERAAEAVAPLLVHLAGYDLPPPVKALLWQRDEQLGAFAGAEDWLFALLDDDPGALESGIAFYERLGHHTDADLARGNLPRDEVAAGLAELRARRAKANPTAP